MVLLSLCAEYDQWYHCPSRKSNSTGPQEIPKIPCNPTPQEYATNAHPRKRDLNISNPIEDTFTREWEEISVTA